MYEKVSSALDKQEYSLGVFIDLSKAFDTLDHQILLKKCSHYGIRGSLLLWLHSYLNSRSQFVQFLGNRSGTLHINCGVPQGSILGPLLFIIYLNDIHNCSKILHFIIFADDTNLFLSNSQADKLINIMNTELLHLSNWFKSNKLSLNIDKTHFIDFSNRRKNNLSALPLSIDGVKISQVDHIKFLGVVVDDKLNWSKHIDFIKLKISKSIGILYKARKAFSINIMINLYYSIIYPHLTYCNIIWGSAKPIHLNKLLVLQKRAIRLCTYSLYCENTDPLCKKYHLLKLDNIHKYYVLLFMFKIKLNLLPHCCSFFIHFNLSTHYEFRNVPLFACSHYRTSIREHSISVFGPRLWNCLPAMLQSLTSIGMFKKTVFDYLLSSQNS